MRGLVATFALIVAIGGLLLVIAYGASEAYLAYRDDVTDLDDSLLLASLVPEGWTAAPIAGVNFRDEFIAPCLQTPLLEGTALSGRGATSFLPPAGRQPGAQLLLIQTSTTTAQGVMDDVARDTENNCQRGVTVGTIDGADVDPDSIAGAERSILVHYDRLIGQSARSYQVLVLQQAGYVAHLSYETTTDPDFSDDDLVSLGAALVARIDRPPTEAQLAAAGALDEPSLLEERLTRLHDASATVLTVRERIPVMAGLAGLGVFVLALYTLGARLSRGPQPLPAGSSHVATPSLAPAAAPAQTIADYGTPERRWIKTSEGRKSKKREPEAVFELEVPEAADDPELEFESEPEPEASGPPPVIEFPQRSIEEKLKILKDARLKAPRREHRAMREVKPNVDWTEEISKTERQPDAPTLEPPTGQVSRKALLKKLRSDPEAES